MFAFHHTAAPAGADVLVWAPSEEVTPPPLLAPRSVSWVNGTLLFGRDHLTVVRSRRGLFGIGATGADDIAYDSIAAAAVHGSTLTITFIDGSRRAVYGIAERGVVVEALRHRGIESAAVTPPVFSASGA